MLNTDTKTCIIEQLDNVKLTRSWYIATYMLTYDSYLENMFVIAKFAHKFRQQLANVINCRPSVELHKEIVMSTYNQF